MLKFIRLSEQMIVNIIKKPNKMSKEIGIFTGIFTLKPGTIFENIIEPLINLKIDRPNDKVYEIFKKLELENLMYKNISDLSYSQKKLVAIVKSIIHSPRIILLDNPFESLDLYYKNKVINYLKSIKDHIVIYTTNNSEDLMISDRIIVLKDGKIVENDKRNNLFLKESIFIKNGIKLPFIIDLSYKLQSYGLIDKLIYNSEEMVNELWK